MEALLPGWRTWVLENCAPGKGVQPSGLRDLLLVSFLLKIKCQVMQRIKGMWCSAFREVWPSEAAKMTIIQLFWR